MTEEEYFNLREDRRLLRNKFEASGSFLEYSAIRKEIKEIDEKLSEYEKNSMNIHKLIREIWNQLIAEPKNKNGSFQLSPGKLRKIIEYHERNL